MSKKEKLDWKDQLRQIQSDIEKNMSPEEKARLEKEKELERKKQKARQIQIQELNKRRKMLYDFLAGYKQNSGIFVNNFFRRRDYETYCMDKFHGFDFDISGILPNVFDSFGFSMQMVHELKELEKIKQAYWPIDAGFVQHLINFAEVMDILDPLQEDKILYRGCSTLDRNGVNGIVSTTTNYAIAEQFSRGTILTIHAPKGTKYINTKRIRPKEQRKKDKENELLLPPCKYTIIREEIRPKAKEPNNYTGQTKHIELAVEPLDLLEEFLKVMENPPREYNPVMHQMGLMHAQLIMYLREYIANRNSQRGQSRNLRR